MTHRTPLHSERNRSRKWRRCIAVGAALAFFVPLAPALDVRREDRCTDADAQCFRFYAACEGVAIATEDAGAAVEVVARAAHSRLRTAGIYEPEGQGNHLHVDVRIDEHTHATRLRFDKVLYDPQTRTMGVATTWSASARGAREDTLKDLSELLDRFLGQYLSANATACKD